MHAGRFKHYSWRWRVWRHLCGATHQRIQLVDCVELTQPIDGKDPLDLIMVKRELIAVYTRGEHQLDMKCNHSDQRKTS